MSQLYETNYTFLIQYKLPPDKVFSIMPTSTIKALVEGTGWDLMNKFYFNKPQPLYINLEQSIPPHLQVAELTERVGVALTGKEISIRRIEPNFVDLIVENVTAHKIPILLLDSLNFEAEYFLKDSIDVMPDSVSVFGPASIIKKYEKWETEVLHIKSINSNIQRNVALKSSLYPQVNLMPDSVQVTIYTDRYSERKMTLPIQVKNAKDSVRIIPKEIELYVILGISDFDKLKESDFLVEVDMKGVTSSYKHNSLPILITKQPSYVKAVRFYDKTVDYFIVK